MESQSRLCVTFSAVECEPFRMVCQCVLVIRHVVQPVCRLPPERLTHTEPKAPHHCIAAINGGTKVEDAHGKVGLHRSVNLWQSERLQFRYDLTDIPRHVPPHSKVSKISADGVEGTTFVISPDINVAVLVNQLLIRSPEQRVGTRVMLVKLRVRVAPMLAGDTVPCSLHPAAGDVVVTSRPRFGRHEVRIVTDQHQPVLAGDNAISSVVQSVGGNPQFVGVRTLPDENSDRR